MGKTTPFVCPFWKNDLINGWNLKKQTNPKLRKRDQGYCWWWWCQRQEVEELGEGGQRVQARRYQMQKHWECAVGPEDCRQHGWAVYLRVAKREDPSHQKDLWPL